MRTIILAITKGDRQSFPGERSPFAKNTSDFVCLQQPRVILYAYSYFRTTN
jgi:hypothetical protein